MELSVRDVGEKRYRIRTKRKASDMEESRLTPVSLLTKSLTRGGSEDDSGRTQAKSGRKQDRGDRKQVQDRSDRKQDRSDQKQDRSDRKRVEDLKEKSWGTSGRSNNRDYTREDTHSNADDSYRRFVQQ